MIQRVDFIGFSVLGPSRRAHTAYRATGADAWPKSWTATLDGPNLVLEGDGQRIEVPRARCIVYHASADDSRARPDAPPPGQLTTGTKRAAR